MLMGGPNDLMQERVLRRQLLQQRLRLLLIARVEPLREPPVNRSKQFVRFLQPLADDVGSLVGSTLGS